MNSILLSAVKGKLNNAAAEYIQCIGRAKYSARDV